jgi:hypothetical protein
VRGGVLLSAMDVVPLRKLYNLAFGGRILLALW